jgi:DNA modification methylase
MTDKGTDYQKNVGRGANLVKVNINRKRVNPRELKEYPSNYNKHPDEQIGELVNSLGKFGQYKEVVTWQGYVIAGWGLTCAAIQAGMPELEVNDRSDLTREQAEALLIADNILPQGAEPDNEMLAALLAGFDNPTEIPGVDEEWIESVLSEITPQLSEGSGGGTEGSAEPHVDIAAELADEWGVKVGQIWRLGEHRVACGDCTDKAVVERLMGREKSEIVFTSPPYSNLRVYSGNDLSIETLGKIFLVFRDVTRYFVVNLGLKFKDKEIDPYWDEWICLARQSGLIMLAWNVWDKMISGSIGEQKQMFATQHEWVFVFGDDTKRLNRTWEKSPESAKKYDSCKVNEKGQKIRGVRQADGSIEISTWGGVFDNKQLGSVFSSYSERSNLRSSHPAMFPVNFPLTYIEAMTNEGEIVIDPFLGSGTTLIACHRLNRKCRGVEISPGYVGVILQRFYDETGIDPELIS